MLEKYVNRRIDLLTYFFCKFYSGKCCKVKKKVYLCIPVSDTNLQTTGDYKVKYFSSGCSAVGSASGLGPGGRRFESCHPDVKNLSGYLLGRFFCCFSLLFWRPNKKRPAQKRTIPRPTASCLVPLGSKGDS